MRRVSISIRDINSIYQVEFHIYDILRPLWSFRGTNPQVFLISSILPVLYGHYYRLDILKKPKPVSISITDMNSIYLAQFYIYDLLKTIVVYEKTRVRKCFDSI